MATCTLLSMNDFSGMRLANRFSPNRRTLEKKDWKFKGRGQTQEHAF